MKIDLQHHRSSLSIIGAMILLSVTACAQAGPGSPESTSTNEPTSHSTQSASRKTNPASEIKDPKNIEAVTDRCQLLTTEQLAQLGARSRPSQDTAPWGEPTCKWSSDQVQVTLAANTVSGGGFSRIRGNKDEYANYKETTVSGYPAARVNFSSLTCGVFIGISKEDTFSASVTIYNTNEPQHSDPCVFAEKVATEALTNIPDAE
ncbi:DUF3558 domain-containing protein [Haloactinomyces albus]|uniref:DUF3558 domain-containing protein n=1 Tax=Haloactinomyces albus TaxID=1352928 RepID=A0AAE3ZD19_9ACTN|nr:DUF3558 domain-containing protein [Haloactinomyces albus]MDR7301501.1 hypothetical protein [Haloactinomyces albus]